MSAAASSTEPTETPAAAETVPATPAASTASDETKDTTPDELAAKVAEVSIANGSDKPVPSDGTCL